MKLHDLQMATALAAQLAALEKAAERVKSGQFKQGFLIIEDLAHGQVGVDSRPQMSQSRIEFDRETLAEFIARQLAAAREKLRLLGVE